MKRLAIVFAATIIFASAYTAAAMREQVNTTKQTNIVAAKPKPDTKPTPTATPSAPPDVETPEPEPTPEPAPIASPAPPQRAVGCENYRGLVSQYNWDVRTMMAVMEAENRACDPNVNNGSAGETHRDMHGNVICVGSYGLFQVGCLHFSGNQDGNDPATNIAVAYAVWQKQGYSAWTMYTNGEYAKFLR